MVYFVALQAVGQFMQLRHKPPVTAAVIAANVAIYMRLGPLDVILPGISSVCLNPRLFLEVWPDDEFSVSNAKFCRNLKDYCWTDCPKGCQ